MSRTKYTCGQCGRLSGLPDFCCGQAMVRKGSYLCKSCGKNTSDPGACCGQDMLQV